MPAAHPAPSRSNKRYGVWYAPGPELDAIVDCVFVEHFFSHPCNQGLYNRIVPDNTVELVITDKLFKRRLSLHGNAKTMSSHLSGLKTAWQDIALDGSPLISVRFKSDKLFQLTGIPAFEFQNHSVHPPDAFGPEFEQLESRLFDQKTTTARLGLIEQFFAKRWAKSKVSEHAAFQNAKTAIEACNGAVKLRTLCKQLNISSKTLENTFKAFLGVSPKAYCGLVRFVHCVKQYKASNVTLTELAYACGYYDQAHMIRAFQKYTGYSPKAFFAQPSGIQEDIF